MTDAHAGVIYKVYGYADNAHWRNLVRDGRAVRLDSGADERGEYVKVKLVKAKCNRKENIIERESCPKCNGEGYVVYSLTDFRECPTCAGSGYTGGRR